jgi:hypothetical protein
MSASRPETPFRDSRAGVILPVALLVLLGGTLMAASLLIHARSAALLADGDRRLARSLAQRPSDLGGWGAEEDSSSETDGVQEACAECQSVAFRELGAEGLILVEDAVAGVAWSLWSVGWRMDPAAVAAGVQAAAETGGGLGDQGDGTVGEIRPGGSMDGCSDPFPLSAHRRHAGSPPPGPEPAPPPFPRLGPVGIHALAGRAGVHLRSGDPFPEVDAEVFLASEGAVIVGGAATGLLLAPGSLRLGEGASFDGLVVVGGDLVLGTGALVRGAVLVGGVLDIGGGDDSGGFPNATEAVGDGPISGSGDLAGSGTAALVGCRAIVAAALAGPRALKAPFPLPGGDFMGRH